eukprot:2241252-Rhodomonas_salina.1
MVLRERERGHAARGRGLGAACFLVLRDQYGVTRVVVLTGRYSPTHSVVLRERYAATRSCGSEGHGHRPARA